MEKIFSWKFIITIVIAGILAFVIREIIVRIVAFFLDKVYFSKIDYNKKNNKPVKKQPEEPHDDLLRDKEKEKKVNKSNVDDFELKNVEKLSENIEDINRQKYNNQERVAGVVKPIGFWTSLILGDKLSEILLRNQALTEGKNNFWVKLVELKKDESKKRGSSHIRK